MNKYACNLLSKLNDAYKRNLSHVDVFCDQSVLKILLFLLKQGYISNFIRCNNKFSNIGRHVRVYLKQPELFNSPLIFKKPLQDNAFAFKKFQLVSHGTNNIYVNYKSIKKFYLDINAVYIISTKKGFMTALAAYNLKIGGKVCFKILI